MSHGVVHVELDRVRGHVQALHISLLELDVAVDHVVSEYAAGGQEGAIRVQCGQGLGQAGADGGDGLAFLGWQVVQVLVRRIAGMELVLPA